MELCDLGGFISPLGGPVDSLQNETPAQVSETP